MTASFPLNAESLEAYRDYLLMLARLEIGPKYRARIDPEAIVNQSLFEAERQRDQFRGSLNIELLAWLKRILGDNITDAIRYQHRQKRDIDREQTRAVGGWDHSYSQLLEITCEWTSPSIKAIQHERELQLASALSQLPNDQREAVELHHLHGSSLAETAGMMDRTTASVVGLLRRGLKRLRELLQESTM